MKNIRKYFIYKLLLLPLVFGGLTLNSCGENPSMSSSEISSVIPDDSFSIYADNNEFLLGETTSISLSITEGSILNKHSSSEVNFIVSDNTCDGSVSKKDNAWQFVATKIGNAKISANIGSLKSTNDLTISVNNSNSSIATKLSEVLNTDGGVVFGQTYPLGINSSDSASYTISGADGIIKINEDGELEVLGFGQGKIKLEKSGVEIYSGRYAVYNSIVATKIKTDLISQGKIALRSDNVPNDLLKYITSIDLSGELINDPTASYGIKYLTQLVSLNVSSNGLSDLSFLSSLSKLKTLIANNNTIEDVSSIVDNEYLEKLDVSNNNISKITKLQFLYHIKYLNLSNNNITDISSLSSSYSLETLLITGNKISNYKDSLSGLIYLKELGIGNCGISFSDVISLKYLPNLTYLDVSGTKPSLENIKTLTNLKTLIISNCSLATQNISILNSLTNLENLDFSDNGLDAEEYGLGILPTSLTKIKTIIMGGNEFTEIPDLSGFTNLETLDLTNSYNLQNITSISTLNIKTLILDDSNSIDVSDGGNSFMASISGLTKLKNLSIVGGFNFINKTIFDSLCAKVDDGEISLRFLKDTYVTNQTILNFKNAVFFSYADFEAVFPNDSTSSRSRTITSLGGAKQIILSLVNDKDFNTSTPLLLKFDKTLFQFDLYGNKFKQYNIAFEINERKESSFTLNFNCVDDRSTTNSPVISSSAGSKLILKNHGISSLTTTSNHYALDVYDLYIPFCSSDADEKLRIIGGNGKKGQDGKDGWEDSKEPRNGKKGEEGYAAIFCHSVYIDSTVLSLSGGDGGNGGNGANAPGTLFKNWEGGDGGDGGNGGVCVIYSGEKYINSSVKMTAGACGNGGSGGARGGLFNSDGKSGNKGTVPTILVVNKTD